MKRFFLFLLMAAMVHAANYYVDNSASSSGDGSLGAPFNSISSAIGKLSAGDTLFIRGGSADKPQIYNESLSFSDNGPNGKPGFPIVMTAMPGEYVTIHPKSKIGVSSSYWVFENLTFDMQEQANDIFRVYGDNNTFRNLTVTNGSRDGFDISNASHTLVENCKIYNFTRNDEYDAHGIIMDGGEGNTFRGNTIWNCKGDCIQIYKANINHNTLIENNTLYTTWGPGSENAIDFKGTTRSIIRNNTMYGFARTTTSDGVALKISKDSDSLLIEYNNIHSSNGGIRIAGGKADHYEIRYNVIHDMEESDSPYTDGYGMQIDGVTDLKIYNNTFANMPGPLFWIADGAKDVMIKNNIFYRAGNYKGSSNDFTGKVDIDYNGWYQVSKQINGNNDVIGNDPSFTDEKNWDYTLKEGSSAIDAGDPSFGSDYPGRVIDLGAFEFDGSITGLRDGDPAAVRAFRLNQNYPNPFNPVTRIAFFVEKQQKVTLRVYNILGRPVATLLDETVPAGNRQVTFNGASLSSGVYFYRLQTESGQSLTRQMMLVK